MTAFAFILGCVPLWTATGAGAIARQTLGTCVIGGMTAATSWPSSSSQSALRWSKVRSLDSAGKSTSLSRNCRG